LIWKIIAVGEPALAFARQGIDEYLSRLRGFGKVQTVYVKPGALAHQKVLGHSDGHFRIILDERGKPFTSRELASTIQNWENRSISRCALLVGGADGWDEATRAQADFLWSLSPLTLQHELALLLALEQIYRAATIKAGMPYHRD
jgi:23S rRNA (pseudouridine1915-N3)-methyltransferase